jgi:Cu(I)/Ag(I) efflux system membrane fusion protein
MRIIVKDLAVLIFLVSLSACENNTTQTSHADNTVKYTCPMHPQVVAEKIGTCPICAMDLVPLKHTGNNSEIMLNDTQMKLANITTTLTQYSDISSTTRLTGKLVVNEEQTELVSSRVQGRIERLYVKEVGRKISKGDVLYEIYSEPLLTLQQEYLMMLQQAKELDTSDRRYQNLLEASKKKLLLFGLNQFQIDHLSKTLKIEPKIAFLSPADGVVARIDASEGQVVSEGSPLYRIEQLDKVWVEAELYPTEMVLVKIGDRVEVVVDGFENSKTNGTVTFMSPAYRSGSQIVTLRVEINNREGNYLPGMQANVLLSHAKKRAIALPTDAVIRDAQGDHIWILTSDGAYASRNVTLGIENENKVEITAGLKEKENVVITGAYLLYSEFILKKGLDPMAGHSHQ